MSLLIDALRKAEADRQKAGGGDASTPRPQVSEALALEPIDLDTAELSPAAPRPTVSGPPQGRPQRPSAIPLSRQSTAGDPSAARNVFESKEQSRAPVSLTTWAIGMGLVIAAIGSTYVWHEIQPRGIQMGPAVAHPSPAEPSAPLPQTAPEPQPPQTLEPEPPQPQEPVEQLAKSEDEADAMLERPYSRHGGASTHQQSALFDDTPIVRRGAPKQVNPATSDIEAGYASYMRGDMDAARERYTAALRNDPRSADAINGLGAVALQSGHLEDAERWFRQALTNNPSDPIAQTGLLSLNREGDPIAIESRLRSAIARDGEMASSHFALGTLQARTERWVDAQQSFFRAYSLEPDNPDYRFNLAVALDHLNKPTLAAQYYELAIAAASQRQAHFDREAASRRLKALTSE